MDAQAIALFLAGLIAPYITNLVKQDKITGVWAAWLALGISVVLAVAGIALTGGLSDALADPTALVEKAGAVFALATIIYKSWPQPTAIR